MNFILIGWVILGVIFLYVLKTLYDVNMHQYAVGTSKKESIPEQSTSESVEDKLQPNGVPPPVVPEYSFKQAEKYVFEDEESGDDKEEVAPLVVKDLIPETEYIDTDCFVYFKGARLLLVEDNIINQRIITQVLKQSGIKIDIAGNGEAALDYLFKKHRTYDLVLMDISMPVLDGIATTKIIRRAARFNTMPIVTFTAFSLGPEIDAMFEAGANAYLTKPLNINQLYTVFMLFMRGANRNESKIPLEKMLEIQGLDIEKGVENADNDPIKYQERLASFVRRYRSSIDHIPKWIEEKRYKRVQLECKEMLPALNLIGAYEMQKVVQEIQLQFIYKNEHLLDRYVLLFRAKMQAMIDTADAYLASVKKEAS